MNFYGHDSEVKKEEYPPTKRRQRKTTNPDNLFPGHEFLFLPLQNGWRREVDRRGNGHVYYYAPGKHVPFGSWKSLAPELHNSNLTEKNFCFTPVMLGWCGEAESETNVQYARNEDRSQKRTASELFRSEDGKKLMISEDPSGNEVEDPKEIKKEIEDDEQSKKRVEESAETKLDQKPDWIPRTMCELEKAIEKSMEAVELKRKELAAAEKRLAFHKQLAQLVNDHEKTIVERLQNEITEKDREIKRLQENSKQKHFLRI